MLYDDGSTTQQLNRNEKNAQAAQELNALKEAAKASNEEKRMKQIATEARNFGRNEAVSEVENIIAEAQQPQRSRGLFDFFVGNIPESTQNLAAEQGQEQAAYEREQNFKNLERLDRMIGAGTGLSEEELNNINVLMNSSKNWTDSEIMDMALNKGGNK